MSRRDAAWLATLALLFLAWHVPPMGRSPAGQDEDWYGVTGITIVRDGIPRTPYITSDDPHSVCYRADVALYTLPPLSFYLQAVVHLAFGEGLGQARLASMLEGLGAAAIVFALGRLWLDDPLAGLMGATTYVLSRPFLFPATMARPDMAAVLFGLAAVWLSSRGGPDPRRRDVAASGLAAGLSLLAHPVGVVPAAQVGLWLLARPGPRPTRRLGEALIFAATALAAFALWLPLIAPHPDLFRAQFLGNVIHRASPGLSRTLLHPLLAVGYQLRRLAEYAGPSQASFGLLGIAWCLILAPATPGGRRLRYHLAASFAILFLFQGRHPTLGYFAYPAALASLAIGGAASAGSARLERLLLGPESRGRGWGTVAALVVVLAAFLPGAGLRALLADLRHRGDPAYDAHALARAVMAEIPGGAVTAVDASYVLDFYLAGRPAIDAFIQPDPGLDLYDVRDRAYEYVVLGPVGHRLYRSRMNDLVLLKTFGDPRDPFAPRADLYRRGPPGPRERPR